MNAIDRIEILRDLLYGYGQRFGFTAPETLAVSQNLDELINQ
ncbi:aspartyl-phosphate phosphatase Spo0E family protein [Mesobacillus foraminis]|nr:aspartyl-phosphate phosphatase Spo0E family protein [Mesobacillus foraminis]